MARVGATNITGDKMIIRRLDHPPFIILLLVTTAPAPIIIAPTAAVAAAFDGWYYS
jgi:hypothetical protein